MIWLRWQLWIFTQQVSLCKNRVYSCTLTSVLHFVMPVFFTLCAFLPCHKLAVQRGKNETQLERRAEVSYILFCINGFKRNGLYDKTATVWCNLICQNQCKHSQNKERSIKSDTRGVWDDRRWNHRWVGGNFAFCDLLVQSSQKSMVHGAWLCPTLVNTCSPWQQHIHSYD